MELGVVDLGHFGFDHVLGSKTLAEGQKGSGFETNDFEVELIVADLVGELDG